MHHTPPPVPCTRCGSLAELPVRLSVTATVDGAYMAVEDAALCVDCDALYFTDRKRFWRRGWGGTVDESRDVGGEG